MLTRQSAAVTSKSSYIIENENILIDISILYEVSDNDENFINRTINIFLKNMSYILSRLQQGLNNQDWNEIYLAAHSAKSSLSVVKVVELLAYITQLENDTSNKANLDKVPALVKKIKEKYLFAEEILNEHFKVKNDILQ